MFENKDPIKCPVEYTLETEEETMPSWVTINPAGTKIQIDNKKFMGITTRLRIKATTEFDYPVYKDVIITDKTGCNVKTLSLPKDTSLITIQVPSSASAGVNSPLKISSYFINTTTKETDKLCKMALKFTDADSSEIISKLSQSGEYI